MKRVGTVLLAGLALFIPQGDTRVVHAQRPERSQGVRMPGTDVRIKAGWKMVFHDGCRFMVPLSWSPDPDVGIAAAADGSNISIRMFNVRSWSAHKAQIKAAFGRVNVMHEDSDRRLWLEIGDKNRIQHYVDVSLGPIVCSALLEIPAGTNPGSEDVVRTIVDSVGAVPNKSP